MRCIEYGGYIGKAGYGLDYDPETKKTISAHRLAFKLAYGYLPKVVMHTCDNRICVNPEHLKAGTQSENIKDSYTKGRSRPPLKLSDDIREAIRMSSGSSRAIGKRFGCNQKTVLNIKKDITGKGGVCGS